MNIFCRSIIVLAILLVGCGKKTEPDTEYPTIDISYNHTFPIQCSSLKRGEMVTFKARFIDNTELGGFSLDIHHNFDHHTHSTEINSCDMDLIKEANNPFLLIKSYTIPRGLEEYIAEEIIEIPSDIDTGDYHFTILLTDKEGWQTIKGLSIKIK